jgi:hypothetical protein
MWLAYSGWVLAFIGLLLGIYSFIGPKSLYYSSDPVNCASTCFWKSKLGRFFIIIVAIIIELTGLVLLLCSPLYHAK